MQAIIDEASRMFVDDHTRRAAAAEAQRLIDEMDQKESEVAAVSGLLLGSEQLEATMRKPLPKELTTQRSGITKNKWRGQSKARRRMTAESRRRNRRQNGQ